MRIILKHLLLLTLGVLLAAGVWAQAQQGPMLSGNQDAAWLAMPTGTGSFNLLKCEAGGKWRWANRDISGNPASVAAVDKRLYVMFRNPVGLGFFSLESSDMTMLSNPAQANWPDQTMPLAMCASPAGSAGGGSSLVAIVHCPPATPETSPATTGPATAPAASAVPATATAERPMTAAPARVATTRPATTKATSTSAPAYNGLTHILNLGVFQNVSGNWEFLGQVEGVSYRDKDRVLAAVHAGKVHILISGPGHPNRLIEFDRGQWRDLPLEGSALTSQAIGLVAMPDYLAMFVSKPAQADKATIEIVSMESGGAMTAAPVLVDQKAPLWDAANLPLAARLKDQMILVWQQDKKVLSGKVRPDGSMSAGKELEAFTEGPHDGQKIQEYFLLSVYGLALFIWFMSRPRTIPKPFALPEQIQTANLIRRLFAAVVDLLPFMTIGWAVFQIPPEALEQVRQAFENNSKEIQIPDNVFYWGMSSIGSYALYCMVMEMLLGATVGKLIFGLRVTGDDGNKADLRSIVLRNLMKIAELSSYPMLLLLVMFPVFTKYRQRLGDMMARTTVVNKKPRATAPAPKTSTEEVDKDDKDEPWPS